MLFFMSNLTDYIYIFFAIVVVELNIMNVMYDVLI